MAMQKHAVYAATRTLYGQMELAAKSLVANSDVDVVHFLIEDAEFPRPLPDIVQVHDVSGQQWFDPDGPNFKCRWTYMALIRAALCHVLPDVDVVLSLDCDTVVDGDATGAWDVPLDGCYYAAVSERRKSLDGMQYGNFGVVLFNLEMLRNGKADECIDVINRQAFRFPEQGVMNYLCQGRIADMPKKYNDMSFNGSVDEPAIVHYAAISNDKWPEMDVPRKYRDMTWDEAIGKHVNSGDRGRIALFSSDRPLERAENLKAVWDAYDGPKRFMQYIPKACRALSPDYAAFVVDCTPQFSRTKGDVRTVFVSHGLPGDKLYGLDKSEHHRAGCDQVDYAVCTTEYTRERYSSEIGLPIERVVATGFPMYDRFFGRRKGDGGTVLSAFRRAYLYAPTWRTGADPPLPSIDWEKVDELLEDDEMIVVKRHMCTKGNLVGKKLARVKEYGNMLPSVPFVIDCDVLATDFSSIMFDAYAMGKPVVLVTDGADAYCESQGMYEDYPSWYGSRAVEAEDNEEAFVAMLRDAHVNGMGEAERKCAETVVGNCDGHASDRVAELVKSLIK